jgi:cellulose synthase/poly-beta-1,6-N-acetylglucosamine synthase-like glycosyltransferase
VGVVIIFSIIAVSLVASLVGIRLFLQRLHQVLAQAATLAPGVGPRVDRAPTVAVIVPAYNEAETIADCVTAVLQSSDLPAAQLTVWVVDDQSTDATLTIVQTLQKAQSDPRLRVLTGQPRPTDQVWVGKNWACTQAAEQIESDFLLFLDADVTLRPGAIAAAVAKAAAEQIDLLTIWPTITCGCLGEWLAQPIIASLFAVGFEFAEINDPQAAAAFAVGPFMLFRRSAYAKIGGHRAMASEVVEDVELARRIKEQGFKLWYGLGPELAAVRMYRSLGALWEGWTKNWYLGSRRNLRRTLYTSWVVFLVFLIPWLDFAIAAIALALSPLSWLHWGAIAFAGGVLAYQLNIRRLSQQFSQIPTRYWWLTGIGALIVTAIPIASIIKTETGWGWTWRGRPLKA